MGSAPDGFRVVDRFLPLPSAKRAHVLVPGESNAAASAGLQQFVTGSGRRAKLASAVVVAATRTGIAPLVVRKKATISVQDDVAAGELPGLVLGSHLAEVLEVERVELAVRVGADRPNGKPVVQVMRPSGESLGFGKVGWNDLTRGMVDREGAVLQELSAHSPASFDVPTILHAARWQGFELLVVSPASTDAAVAGDAPPLDASREISQIGGIATSALAASPWWADIKKRIEGTDHPTLPGSIEAIELAYGTEELTFGGAHGDWTPWNMGRRSGRLIVWDWERFRTDVPWGSTSSTSPTSSRCASGSAHPTRPSNTRSRRWLPSCRS